MSTSIIQNSKRALFVCLFVQAFIFWSLSTSIFHNSKKAVCLSVCSYFQCQLIVFIQFLKILSIHQQFLGQNSSFSNILGKCTHQFIFWISLKNLIFSFSSNKIQRFLLSKFKFHKDFVKLSWDVKVMTFLTQCHDKVQNAEKMPKMWCTYPL